eukprot:scaffold26472_cov30-Prasinocladus_malaysianus.AAC.1
MSAHFRRCPVCGREQQPRSDPRQFDRSQGCLNLPLAALPISLKAATLAILLLSFNQVMIWWQKACNLALPKWAAYVTKDNNTAERDGMLCELANPSTEYGICAALALASGRQAFGPAVQVLGPGSWGPGSWLGPTGTRTILPAERLYSYEHS